MAGQGRREDGYFARQAGKPQLFSLTRGPSGWGGRKLQSSKHSMHTPPLLQPPLQPAAAAQAGSQGTAGQFASLCLTMVLAAGWLAGWLAGKLQCQGPTALQLNSTSVPSLPTSPHRRGAPNPDPGLPQPNATHLRARTLGNAWRAAACDSTEPEMPAGRPHATATPAGRPCCRQADAWQGGWVGVLAGAGSPAETL